MRREYAEQAPHVQHRLGAEAAAPIRNLRSRSCLKKGWPIFEKWGIAGEIGVGGGGGE